MGSPVLIPCLVQLFKEFERIAPERDNTSDGWVGDQAHQNSTSDHNPDETGSVPIHDADSVNEVHAIDVDVDLREPDLTMEQVVQFLLGRCRSGAEKRLRYIIYNRRIWEASNGWRERDYTGSNAHDKHAHFSASYDTNLEASTASWHLEDLVAAPTAKEVADAVGILDINPDADGVDDTYQWKGASWTTYKRVEEIRNDVNGLVADLSAANQQIAELSLAVSNLTTLIETRLPSQP